MGTTKPRDLWVSGGGVALHTSSSLSGAMQDVGCGAGAVKNGAEASPSGTWCSAEGDINWTPGFIGISQQCDQ